MPEQARRELIELALPLEAINRESAREKSIRHGTRQRCTSGAPPAGRSTGNDLRPAFRRSVRAAERVSYPRTARR